MCQFFIFLIDHVLAFKDTFQKQNLSLFPARNTAPSYPKTDTITNGARHTHIKEDFLCVSCVPNFDIFINTHNKTFSSNRLFTGGRFSVCAARVLGTVRGGGQRKKMRVR